MNDIFLTAKVLWAQLDPNMHLRHSAYSDFAAQARVEMLQQLGMDAQTMQSLNIGPILFREETVYLKEIRAGETIRVSCKLKKCREDGARWSFSQEIIREDGTPAALISVDGAWIDMQLRRLTAPPKAFTSTFLENLPRTEDFELTQLPQRS